jgi:hypothetical protein
MIAVVTDSKLAPDQFRDARRGPYVGVAALRQRPFQQYLQQATLLDRFELLWATGRKADLQSCSASPLPSIVPSHYGTGRALNASSHLVE